ncbi:CDP-glycerol glycerophosphotransferase family protein [Pediococcus claussenii]|nr:CDP-glycerol glycerophosphotransferase family protein [Pediococcus claussenii]ANZ69532.1 ribitolphosphotransferase [Pediococcus claussenii]ANZ71351.1 ribitolphosphotransferase [Pediococcus claussenii]
MEGVKVLRLNILRVTFNVVYQIIFHLIGPRKRRVVFASMRNDKLADNLKFLYKEFEKDGSYEIKLLLFHYDRTLTSKLRFLWTSWRSLYYMATAELFIIDDYYFPLYAINKHSENTVVQLWHAIGSLKQFGLSLPSAAKSVIKPHTNYDWVFINAEIDKPAYEEAFDVEPSHILAFGEPMMDELMTAQIPTHTGVQWMLYSPTYRAGNPKLVLSLVNDMIKSSHSLTGKWEIYISLHPYLKLPDFKDLPSNVHIFQDAEKVKTLLPGVDVFITDYSSLSLNFSYFERPILLFTPDYKQYVDQNGFYVNYYQYLGAPHFDTADQVIFDINQNLETMDLKYVKKLKTNTFPFQDGKNSQRVFDFLNKLE